MACCIQLVEQNAPMTKHVSAHSASEICSRGHWSRAVSCKLQSDDHCLQHV